MAFRDAIIGAFATLQRVAGVSVSLRRRGYADVSVTALPGSTMVEQITGDGSSMRSQSRDYLISVSDYAFGGSVSTPQVGDLIVETVDGVEQLYQLLPFAGEACARHSDQTRVTWRCHTKLILRAPSRVLTEDQLRCLLGLMPTFTGTWTENKIRHAAGIVSTAA